MIADIARVKHLHREFTPVALIRFQFLRVKLVVEDASLTPNQMRVEVIRLEAIDDRGSLADGAVFEAQDCHAGSVVFVWSKNVTLRSGAHARYAFNLCAHQHQKCVERMTTGSQQSTAPFFLKGIPAKLTVPRANA